MATANEEKNMTNETVSFTQMKDGTAADYHLLQRHEQVFHSGTADRLLDELRRHGEASLEGYRISRLEHALQSATRAEQDGADIDWVVGTLLHDIGDGLAPQNHDRFAAELMRPFVRWDVSWVVEHHGIFQMIYYAHHYGWNPNTRDEFKEHACFESCERFCERWDQASFDPDFESKSLTYFEPMLREVFARKAYAEDVIQQGVISSMAA